MTSVETRWSKHRRQDPQSQEVEQRILLARDEYASMDTHGNTHEYLGVVAELDHVLDELAQVIDRDKTKFPAVQFTLEYHPSCVIDTASHDPVYTFTLASKTGQHSQQKWIYSFISWQFPPKDEYTQENAQILAFMSQHGVEKFDDGSGIECTIE